MSGQEHVNFLESLDDFLRKCGITSEPFRTYCEQAGSTENLLHAFKTCDDDGQSYEEDFTREADVRELLRAEGFPEVERNPFLFRALVRNANRLYRDSLSPAFIERLTQKRAERRKALLVGRTKAMMKPQEAFLISRLRESVPPTMQRYVDDVLEERRTQSENLLWCLLPRQKHHPTHPPS
jgi:hypothetical protein